MDVRADAAVFPAYSFVMDDVLVLSGHARGPLSRLLVQTVLLGRSRLRLQLTALIYIKNKFLEV